MPSRPRSAHQVALRLLARREYSTSQIRVRLARRELPEPEVDAAIARLTDAEELGDPKVVENNQRAQELGREYARLKELVAQGEQYLKTRDELRENAC